MTRLLPSLGNGPQGQGLGSPAADSLPISQRAHLATFTASLHWQVALSKEWQGPLFFFFNDQVVFTFKLVS